ncbi:54S ribosomal protein L25, mitochondrial [Teratosphaeriaceae sp. CCFEE 6253]|nr:54S ribosomal protein L25, mitochondrial [Teratosphaeriaceae sp. CCFEE 6253]
MATTSAASHIALAQSLPPRLLHFFKRFPPAPFQAASPDLDPPSTTEPVGSSPPPSTTKWKHNPFLPAKNPTTQAWHGPHYSLRRQADLFRLAAEHHVLPLMPVSPKHPTVKAASRIEHGLRVKGTGEGQRVKGKHWERTLRQRLDTRRKAMESMPDMVALWKEKGHGKGWKKFPRGKGDAAREEVFKSEMRHAWVHERAAPSI